MDSHANNFAETASSFPRCILFLLPLWLTACSSQPAPPTTMAGAMNLIDHRDRWGELPQLSIPRHPAEKFLNGMTIVIDPGHGGDAWKTNWKRGPHGVREAEINLRVSLLLARLLEDAGVKVILTRESDTDLDLDERAAMANGAVRADGGVGADLFISIHHNATSSPTTNFTSVWYHGSVDDNEPDLDVARYVAHALGRHMRTQVAKTSPILSSQLMYAGGFGVLRNCHVPAILCECSFFTDPDEEKRLQNASYNLREAYGIYEGLCEYAYCGRPTESVPAIDGRQITTTLNEGLPDWWGKDTNRIITSTIDVMLDGKRLPITYTEKTRALGTTLPSDIEEGEHVLEVHFANLFKNHNWPQRYEISVNRGESTVKSWMMGALPASRPTLNRKVSAASGPRRPTQTARPKPESPVFRPR